jgi:hypothetical protein
MAQARIAQQNRSSQVLYHPVNFVSFVSFLVHVYLNLHAVDIRFPN